MNNAGNDGYCWRECEKPLQGLRPRNIWILERIAEIREAMTRYAKAGKDIPSAWMVELLDLKAKA